jgi:hypothetical protein
MEWRHNLIFENERTPFLGVALTLASHDRYTLWVTDPAALEVHRIGFDGQGTIGRVSPSPEGTYDALLPYTNGYALTRYKDGAAHLAGYTPEHRELWKGSLPEADSPRWSLAAGADGTIYILYSSCNPHDAYRQAHVVAMNSGGEPALRRFFTVPDDDYPLAQLVIAQPEQLAVCVRSYGAGTVYYLLTPEAEITKSGAFSAHPHSKWAVPLCQTPLENGDILIGGYKEYTPGQRRAWVCRFDADISALNGKIVVGDAAEQAVTAFAPQPDGGVLGLCPPWRIVRLSSKGLLTHEWEVPAHLRRNVLTAILTAPGGGCFITGRSYSYREDKLSPAVWLGRLGLNGFTEL